MRGSLRGRVFTLTKLAGGSRIAHSGGRQFDRSNNQ